MATQYERLMQLRRKTSPMADLYERIQMIKGDKGERGDGPAGKDGRDGKDGRSIVGPAGKDGRDGKDGRSIVGPAGKDGRDGKDGKNAISPSPQTIIDAVIRELTAGETLKPEHIGIQSTDITNIRELVKFLKAGGFRGGGGSSTGTGGTPFPETVSGTIDGVNRAFTVPTTIISAQALYLANSVYQPVIDFTTSGKTITMTIAPDISLAGQPFWILHT